MKPVVVACLVLTVSALLASCASTQQNATSLEGGSAATIIEGPPEAKPADPNRPVITKLDSAVFDPEADEDRPQPTSITIDSLDIDRAPIGGVGIEPNGEMEVPGPRDVGWYSFGVAPGAEGSSVLAAHIASEGQDGVFRYLEKIAIGDSLSVAFDDAPTLEFEITRLEQYNKTELPFEDIFRRSGEPQLVLITCGGDFNPSASSYEDNVVAYAKLAG